eukprot:GHRR01012111.1.p1 GENE.GHRR01012111.1~~GHRR01012111.1.p1  ORF type:complete len:279 (+),score=77.62 GHRR01012111.1:492-1328(+)
MFYGSNVWDPVLIIAQIVTVQCLFYISLGLIQAITLGPLIGHVTVVYTFSWVYIHFKTNLGWLNWMAHIISSVAAAAILAWIVERAKRCLDFGATLYIWHLIFVCWYSGWPGSLAWWIANSVGFVTTVLLGEWFCVRRELQDIPLSLHKWGSRKESGGIIQLNPLEELDALLPPRARLRSGTAASSTTQRAAAANGSSLLPGVMQPLQSGSKQPILVQLATLNANGSAASLREGSASGRKKGPPSRPASSRDLGAVLKREQPPASSPAAAVDVESGDG